MGANQILGQPHGAEAGKKILEAGGNAIDGAVTAALVAAVVALPSTGIGGYGGCMVIGLAGGKVTSFDFNGIAPANPPAGQQVHGWLACGVPGVPAGLDLALHRYGTRTFRECVAPAIRLIGEGFALPAPIAQAVESGFKRLSADPASAALYGRGGKPLQPGETYRNPDLAKMLEGLARDNSTEAFYRGAVGRHMAAEFARHGGRVTADDLAAFEAREVRPLRIDVGQYSVYTAPLTAGGATSLQALLSLRGIDPQGPAWAQARLEAQRIAWNDRLTLFGDPDFVKVPVERLLSSAEAERAGAAIRRAVAAHKPVELPDRPLRPASGTIHVSASDVQGNVCSVTLTHGDGFGACVTVPGLGLTLGHGVSRFNPDAGHPNSIGPRKRPLHNMCPMVVTRSGKPTFAVGATGGRRIPSSIFDVLVGLLFEGKSLEQAVAAPRMNTQGGLDVGLTAGWTTEVIELLRRSGYRVAKETGASVQALALAPRPAMASGPGGPGGAM